METDDHKDLMLNHLITLAALKPSTVMLRTERAGVPDPLKTNRQFNCPDQLLRFGPGPIATPDKDFVDVICQLFAVICNARF